MLKTVSKSSNKKLGNIAATYRAGAGNVYSTCPSTCPLKPNHGQGANEVDEDYLYALLGAVPENGISWTYTHFLRESIPKPGTTGEPETTINISCDSIEEAVSSFSEGYPTVVVTPSSMDEKMERIGDVRFVRCPAEYLDHITCEGCGGSRGPLCAQPSRDFVVKFTAHGASKKKIDIKEEGVNGGCYGSGGPVHLQWRKTANSTQEIGDAEVLCRFVAGLPANSMIRHHVLGDLGYTR